jgi:hypothetical protein
MRIILPSVVRERPCGCRAEMDEDDFAATTARKKELANRPLIRGTENAARSRLI